MYDGITQYGNGIKLLGYIVILIIIMMTRSLIWNVCNGIFVYLLLKYLQNTQNIFLEQGLLTELSAKLNTLLEYSLTISSKFITGIDKSLKTKKLSKRN